MSGTLLSAQKAKDLAGKQTIQIFEFGSTALGLGLLAFHPVSIDIFPNKF
ncbi:MAG: hypothetical protein WA113_03710 [Desulfitobacteriaceae bacterium]